MHSISILCTLVALCAVLLPTFGSSSVVSNCPAGATCAISGSSTTTSTTSATVGKNTENNKHTFLKEKPKDLQTCQRKSADFDKCIVNAYQNIFSTWKQGIDGVPHSTPIDPLFVQEFEVIEDRENITPIAVKINNITVTGLSEAKVKSVNFKDNEYDFKMTYLVPKIRLNGHYTAKGHVLLLKLDTSGEMFMEILEGLYTVTTKVKLDTLENHKFFNLKALQFNVDTIKDLNLHFDNLFKDKVLNENTNAVFNDSWRVFFDIFKPKIEAEINKVLLAHFRSVFAQVPAEFFIADVATAEVASAEHDTSTSSTAHSRNIKDITHLELQQTHTAHGSGKAEEKEHKLH
ncbi:uncharacterized protein LOC120778853 [Bactrocera tryoni]|uniref:uncharacterized protein LOC120778853 n=1 Tax=Bactrocera tryoni TaxID=59916 RepID=UPI001A98A3F5|nr:uncharacterized protein LOC120778853 [Bactrocera tryoni]